MSAPDDIDLYSHCLPDTFIPVSTSYIDAGVWTLTNNNNNNNNNNSKNKIKTK